MSKRLTAPELPNATRERLIEDLQVSATVSETMALDQIARLDTAEREKRMERLTWIVTILTVVNVVLVAAEILPTLIR